MNVQKHLVAFIIVLVAGDRSLAANHPPLHPIKPPQIAETAEEIAQVKAILAEGKRQKDRINRDRRLRTDLPPVKVKMYLPRLRNNRTVGAVGVFAGNNLTPFEVFQVIDGDTMLIKNGKEIMCLEGFSTAGIADKDNVRLAALMQVTGTTQYRTAIGGTRTVFVIEPFPLSPVRVRARAGQMNKGAKKVVNPPKG